jgi:hypothetical protein
MAPYLAIYAHVIWVGRARLFAGRDPNMANDRVKESRTGCRKNILIGYSRDVTGPFACISVI